MRLLLRIQEKLRGGGDWVEFLLMMIFTPFISLFLGAAILTFNVYAGVIVASFSLLFCTLILVDAILNHEAYLQTDAVYEGIPPWVQFEVGILPGFVCAAFAVLSMGLWELTSGAAFVGFVPTDDPRENFLELESVLPWLGYSLDNFFRAAFFDFAETYYIDISSIRHADNFAMNSTVFGYKTLVSITFVSIYFHTLKWAKGRFTEHFFSRKS